MTETAVRHVPGMALSDGHIGDGGTRVLYADESLGVGVWERLEQDGVDDREDRRGAADAEGEREDGRRGERRLPQETSRGVSQMSQHHRRCLPSEPGAFAPAIVVVKPAGDATDVSESCDRRPSRITR